MTRHPEDLTQKEAARRLKITARRLRDLSGRGDISRNEDKSYPWPLIREEHRALKAEADRKRGVPVEGTSYYEARARHEATKARMAELELMVREGELINVADHRASLARIMDAFRAALLSIPGSWGPRIVGIGSPAEGTEAMRVCSEELLRDLANRGGQS